MKTIEELQRAVDADSDNVDAKLALYVAKTRLNRDYALEPLHSREDWNSCPEHIQDLIIKNIEKRLGSEYKLKGIDVWECWEEDRFGMPCSQDEWDAFYDEGFDIREDGFLGKRIAHRLATFTHQKTNIEFNLIPGNGTPLLFARWPVTRAQFGEMGLLASQRDLPVGHINLSGVEVFLRQHHFDLPSSSEWLHACRAGSTTRYYWGEFPDSTYCWYSTSSVVDGRFCRHRVTEHDNQMKWNAFGLVDMIGNVWEIIKDGGSLGGSYLTSAIQNYTDPGSKILFHNYPEYGFRVVKRIPGYDEFLVTDCF